VIVRRLWRGRGRTSALAVSLHTDDGGHNVASIEVLHQDAAGRLQSGRAITLAIHKLPELAAALVSAHRRAIELALIEHRGPQR
jgi:hypothetical protein